MNKHVVAAILANALFAVVFVPLLNYAMVQQFEETIVFLGLLYAVLSSLTNVVIALLATRSMKPLPILLSCGLVLTATIAAGMIGTRITF